MAYETLKSLIDANVRRNGKEEITGQILNTVLNAMTGALGEGALFMGEAAPSLAPNVNDGRRVWVATATGIYSNMGGFEVKESELAFLFYDGTKWGKMAVDMGASSADFQTLRAAIEDAQANAERLNTAEQERATAAETALSQTISEVSETAESAVVLANSAHDDIVAESERAKAVEATKLTKTIKTTWASLKALRDASKLIPGQSYRITDYVTTTSQKDTRSAGHVFDIIVTADSANALNENAHAARHAGDEYFNACKLEAWKLLYCLDNDKTRFAWADENGKGVIFEMEDEWTNKAGFDFKNILFLRDEEWFNNHTEWCDAIIGENPQRDIYFYFLSYLQDGYSVEDASLVLQGVKNDEYNYNGVFGNVIEACSDYYLHDSEGLQQIRLALPNNVIVNSAYYIEDDCFYGCYSNTFGNGCHSNTFGNYCRSNTFGNDCHSNTFGNGCNSNTFGNDCYSNTFGNDCYSNTFGNGCYSNTFGNGCYSNTFGNNCYSNTFGNYCPSNTFGNDCHSNTFGNGCNSNTFGNGCNSNTFGNDCYSNTFGNYCYSNTFGNETGKNATKVGYCRYITVSNGCQYLDITTTTAGSSSNYLQNVYIHEGVAGTYSARKTIKIASRNNAFCTDVRTAADKSITV